MAIITTTSTTTHHIINKIWTHNNNTTTTITTTNIQWSSTTENNEQSTMSTGNNEQQSLMYNQPHTMSRINSLNNGINWITSQYINRNKIQLTTTNVTSRKCRTMKWSNNRNTVNSQHRYQWITGSINNWNTNNNNTTTTNHTNTTGQQWNRMEWVSHNTESIPQWSIQ